MVEGESKKSNTGLIVILVIVGILLVGLAIFLIIYFARRGGTTLEINGSSFTTGSPTTIQATWQSTGNDNDTLILYGSVMPFTINKETGKPNTTTGIVQSSIVPTNTKMASLVNLTPNTSYNLALVVTNPSISNDSATNTGVVTTRGTGDFLPLRTPGSVSRTVIEVLNTPDLQITYVPELGNGAVARLTNNGSNMVYDNGVLCVPTDNSVTTCNTNTDTLLYSGGGNVRIGTVSQPNQTPITSDLYNWTYTNARNWCLTSDPNTCMTSGGASVLTTTSSVATQWNNTTVNL